MKQRLIKIAKWSLYPAFYLFALFTCFYLTFPWDKVKDRVIAEFDKSQAAKGDKAWRLEIGTLSGYWLSGVEITGAKIIIPADDDKSKSPQPTSGGTQLNPAVLAAMKGNTLPDDDAKPKDKDAAKTGKDGVILVERARVRLRLLPLLIGRVRIDFSAQALGGDVKGTIPIGSGTLETELTHVDLSQVAPLRDLVSVPVKGVASGKLELSNEGGKWSKAAGSLDLTVNDVAIGDGKSKLAGMATLPVAQLGKLEITAKATDGLLKFEKFGATGKDVEIIGNGFLRLKEPWDLSTLDFVIRIGFSDAYRQKDDKTKSLFGDPNDPFPALIDQTPKMKQAKREDGMYGFRGRGALRSLKWDPTTEDGPQGAPAAGGTDAAGTTAGATAGAKKKPPAPGTGAGNKKKGFNVEHDPANSAPPSPPEARSPATPSPDQGGLPTENAPPPPGQVPMFNPGSFPVAVPAPQVEGPAPPATAEPTPQPAPEPSPPPQ